jgi:VanZ family protein
MEIISASYPSHLMRLLGRYLPPLALMGLIFFLSAQPDLKTSLGLVDLILRKIVHTAEFGLLWFLWLRAFRYRAPWWAAAVTIGYAATDEVHQHFVHGRIGSPLDWAIDGIGVAVAFWLWTRARPRRSEPLDPAALGGDEDSLGAVDRAQLPVNVVQVGADGAGRQ